MAVDDDLPGPWAKTYKAKTKEELLEAYSEWSETYDEDSVNKFGYIAPMRAAQELSRHIIDRGFSKNLCIADIGAGTGLVGKELKTLGYSNIIGIDYSIEMLSIAKTKNCYKALLCKDLDDKDTLQLEPKEEEEKEGTITTANNNKNNNFVKKKEEEEANNIEKLLWRPNSFDAAISVGTFTPHHVGIDALLIVLQLIKPGGILLLSLRDDFVDDDNNGFRQKLNDLETLGKIQKLNITNSELYTSKVSQTIYFRCWTYLVL